MSFSSMSPLAVISWALAKETPASFRSLPPPSKSSASSRPADSATVTRRSGSVISCFSQCRLNSKPRAFSSSLRSWTRSVSPSMRHSKRLGSEKRSCAAAPFSRGSRTTVTSALATRMLRLRRAETVSAE